MSYLHLFFAHCSLSINFLQHCTNATGHRHVIPFCNNVLLVVSTNNLSLIFLTNNQNEVQTKCLLQPQNNVNYKYCLVMWINMCKLSSDANCCTNILFCLLNCQTHVSDHNFLRAIIKQIILRVKSGWHVSMTTPLPSLSRLSGKYKSLSVSQSYGPLRPVREIALLFFLHNSYNRISVLWNLTKNIYYPKYYFLKFLRIFMPYHK